MSQHFLTLAEVIDKTTLKESEIRRRMADGTFPSSVPIGERRVVWVEAEVDAWMREQIQAARPITSKPSEG